MGILDQLDSVDRRFILLVLGFYGASSYFGASAVIAFSAESTNWIHYGVVLFEFLAMMFFVYLLATLYIKIRYSQGESE